jgi:hypothetical protein
MFMFKLGMLLFVFLINHGYHTDITIRPIKLASDNFCGPAHLSSLQKEFRITDSAGCGHSKPYSIRYSGMQNVDAKSNVGSKALVLEKQMCLIDSNYLNTRSVLDKYFLECDVLTSFSGVK